MNSKRRPFSLMLLFLLTISLSSLPSLVRTSSTSRIALHQENGEQRQGLEGRFRSLFCFFHCLPSSSTVSFIHSLQEDQERTVSFEFEPREQSFVYLAIFLENLLLKASLSHSFSSFCLHVSLRETLSAVFYGLMRVLYVFTFFLSFFGNFFGDNQTKRRKRENRRQRSETRSESQLKDQMQQRQTHDKKGTSLFLINQEFVFSCLLLFLDWGCWSCLLLLLFHELLVNDAYHVMTEALLQLKCK